MVVKWNLMNPQSNEWNLLCPQNHEDHVASKGFTSMTHYKFVQEFLPMPRAMKIPNSKAAVDKEWKKLETIPAWQLGPGTPGSLALRNPHPKSPCVGEEGRAGLGQTLPTGSPIVGSREPVQKILRSTLLHSSRARHVRLGRRVNSLPYVLL